MLISHIDFVFRVNSSELVQRRIMSSRASWERGRRELERISGRGFGEVFVALDKKSNDLVAIKKVKPLLNEDELENEWMMV